MTVPSGVDDLLARARARLPHRPTPSELVALRAEGALVVDIRPIHQRERDGWLPGAVVVDRNVLEWRLDPTSPHALPIAPGPDQVVVLVCDEGYASSLAAATLQDLGLHGTNGPGRRLPGLGAGGGPAGTRSVNPRRSADAPAHRSPSGAQFPAHAVAAHPRAAAVDHPPVGRRRQGVRALGVA